jgi:iron complex outermembrane receptor protein
MGISRYSRIVCGIAGGLGAAAAGAAEPPAPSVSELSEITVTGQRREESLVQAAVSVSVFDADALREANIRRAGDFLALTPNVTFVQSSQPGELFVTIRGNTQVREGDTSTAFVIDGVQQLGQNLFNQEMFGIEAIEVLKGPQGSLYGRNALGGAVVIRTRDPSFDSFVGDVKAGVGNGEGYTASATISGPLTETLAFTTGASYRRSDGLYRNDFTGEDPHRFAETSAFARLMWKPSEGLTFDLRGRYQNMKGGALGWNALLTPQFVLSQPPLAGLFNLFPNAPAVDGDNTSIPYEANIGGFVDNWRTALSLKIDWELGGGVLSSVTSLERSRDFFGGDAFPYRFTGGFPIANTANQILAGETQSTYREDQFLQQEVRFASPQDRPLRYIVGAQYIDYEPLIETMSAWDSNGVNLRRAPQPRGSLNQTTGWTAGEQSNEAYAGFANVFWSFSEAFELTVAARYDEDKKKQQNFVGCNPPASGEIILRGAVFCDSALQQNVLVPTFVRRPGASREATFSKWQPKVALRWSPTEATSAYASYALGFKTGGFNPFGTRALLQAFNPNTTVQDVFDQEEAETYEIGVKSELLDRRARFGAAVFFTETTNAQLLEFRPEATLLAISTAEQVDMKGIEADLTAAVTPNLTVQVAAGYIDTEIKQFLGNPAFEGGSRPQVPKVSGAAAATYRWALADRGSAVARLDYSYTGKTYWDWGNTEGSARSAFGLVNARVAYEADSWSVALWSRNLTDKEYNSEVIPIISGLVDALYRAPPRTYGIEFGYRW